MKLAAPVRYQPLLLTLLLLSAMTGGCHSMTAGATDTERRGLQLMQVKGCNSCHSLDGSNNIGPSFRGLYGSTVTVIRGDQRRRVTVDDAFVIRSIREPAAELDARFPGGGMPIQTLTDAEEQQVVAALKFLRKPATNGKSQSLWWIIVGALLFVGGHLLLSSEPLRRRLVDGIGQGPFMGLYSLVALTGLGLLIAGWTMAPFVELWRPPTWTRYLPLVGMPFVCVLLAAGFMIKNPASMGQIKALDRPNPAQGILRVTRHPQLMAYALWALLHLTTNGALRDLILFGSIAILAVAGAAHIDRRRARELGESWTAFRDATSVLPFGAIVGRRNRLSLKEIGVMPWVTGLVVFGLLLVLHQLFASPWPFR